MGDNVGLQLVQGDKSSKKEGGDEKVEKRPVSPSEKVGG
jgi:hypothetical protein